MEKWMKGLLTGLSALAAVCGTGAETCRMPENAFVVQNVRGYNSWPMVQAMGNRLVCSYSRDNAFPADGHTIHPGSRDAYAKYSDDGGRTWSAEVAVASDPAVGEVNEGIGLDSTGAAIAWVRCWGGKNDRRHELYRTTDGVRFEKIASISPEPFPMQVMDPIPVPSLGLVSFWFAGEYRKGGDNSWGMLVSADDGHTWTNRVIEKGLSVKEWVTEPSCVHLGGGRLLVIGRCEQGLGTQFQVTSEDCGRTWKKARTNIGDVRESTPSLVYDPKSGLVSNYYYHRGARKLKRRVASAEFIFKHPESWPEPEVLAEGYEKRPHDAGNVKVTRLGDRDCCAWYTGTPSDASVVLTVVPAPHSFTDRWVFVHDMLTDDAQLDRMTNAVRLAASHGANGILLDCGLDCLRHMDYRRRARTQKVIDVCGALGLEVIPDIWSAGHGVLVNSGINRMEGVPVENAPFIAGEGAAVWDRSAANEVALDAATGWNKVGGMHRWIKTVDVKPHRRYRLSFSLRTIGLKGSDGFRVLSANAKHRQWFPSDQIRVPVEADSDWTEHVFDFNTFETDRYHLYVGCMTGWQAGTFELKDVRLAEAAPTDVLSRPGAPRTLRNARTGESYREGADYEVPPFRRCQWKGGEPMVELKLPSGSRIAKGTPLRFDCYVPALVEGGCYSTCLSEPEIWKKFEESAADLEELLHPKKWFFSMDEFRTGNTCAACRARGLEMAQLYGEALTRMHGIVRRVHPGAEIYVWSDMLDPNHNGVEQYYNCRGSFEGAWKLVPKDLVIACWYDRKCEESLAFFSGHGFRTLAASYYDEKPAFVYSRRFRDAARRTEGTTGFMFTTWRHNYADLPAYMKMMGE